MADITLRFDDGTTHVYENAPDSLTRNDVLKRASTDFPNKNIADIKRESFAEMGMMDVATKAVQNLPSSTANMIGDIVSAISSPLQTGKAILDVGAGALQNIFPERLVQAIGEDKASRDAANAVGQFYMQRYGSPEAVKKVIAQDPAGFMADMSTVLTGGAAATAKLPQVAGALSKTASMVDPLALMYKGATGATKAIGGAAENILGATTGVGREAISQAFKAGEEGGQRAKEFTSNLRGSANMMDVLDIAKQNLEQLRIDRSTAYKSNMKNIKGDKSILNFEGIDKALDNAMNQVSYKGQIKNQAAADELTKARTLIENWKKLDPAEYHTPEGMDSLKQSVGQILEDLKPRTTPDMVIKGVYNSIKSEINSQAPTYSKTMKAYTESSEQIKEIERALSLGDKASADTAMRKLQSLMRNNVNTNYGQRLKLAQELEQAGGQQMMPSLAGQAMQDWMPRGMQRVTAPLGVTGLFSVGGPAAAGLGAAASSPRLVGEAAYGAGKVSKGLLDINQLTPTLDYPALLNMMYQAEQLKKQAEQSKNIPYIELRGMAQPD